MRQAGEFLRAGVGGRRVFAFRGAVVVAAPGTEARRTRLQGLAQQRTHGLNVRRCGHAVCLGALAHHVHAQGVVGYLHQVVQAAWRGRQRVHVLHKALPVPDNALVQGGTRNILHPLHQLDQVVLMAGAFWRKAHAAVAHHQSGHAVVNAGGKAGVPGHLPVVMGVYVNEARRQPQARSVCGLACRGIYMAHGHNAPVLHAHIGRIRRRARAVHHGGIFKQPVEHLVSSRNRPASCH